MAASRAAVLAISSLLAALPCFAKPAEAGIAVVVDGLSDQTLRHHKMLASELVELTREARRSLSLPEQPTHVGDYTLEGARQALNEALRDPNVDVIVGLGFFVGIAAAEADPFPKKPIILPFASPRFQQLPELGSKSGRRNLSYLRGRLDFAKDIARFREVIESTKVVFLVDDYVLESEQAQAGSPNDLLDSDVSLVSLSLTAEDTLARIPKATTAVYLPTFFRMPFTELQALIDGLNQRRIASYAGMGAEWVEKGAYVTLVPTDSDVERFRRVGLYIRDALRGDNLAEVSTRIPRRTELLLNLGTARRIGVFPTFELMTEARVIDAQPKKRPQLDLMDALESALSSNPGYRATLDAIRVSEAELREARGNLLPSIDATGNFDWIDPDVANEVANAERTLSWGLTATQLIYAPAALQAYFAQQKGLDSVSYQRREAELDLMLEVIQSFFTVLQSRAIERLNRDNLRLTRTNRGLAELRVEIGTSGRQDVARWEIALADGRATTISASAGRNQAEIDLNRIMNVEIERAFVPRFPKQGPKALIIDERLEPYVNNLQAFRIFRDFMAQEALANAPELALIDARIEQQAAFLDGLRQQLYLPNVGLFGGFTNVLNRSGAASGNVTIPGFPDRDDFTWQFGLSLEFNLFSDTRYGLIQQIDYLKSQLEAQREDVANRVEQRVRSALHQVGASSATVRLRERAVAAARINLEAVTAGYRGGRDTIITLIDAQTQALAAEINAATALYQFLSDYAAAERAAGRFQFRQPPEKQEDFRARLDAFARQARASEESSQ